MWRTSSAIAWALVAICATAGTVRANDNDLVISRLGTIVTDSGGDPIDVIGDPALFRSFASELGVVMAPRLVEPADTIGFSGFQFAVDFATTSISADADQWRVLKAAAAPSRMSTMGFFVRKGMWLPLPSFELGAGIVNLLGSRMYAPQAYAKFALHEGFHSLPLPSVAVRGAVSRVMGTDQIDLTIPSIDVSVSKHFGIAGLFNVAPYVGWNWLLVVPRSEVIDKTPNVDSLAIPSDGAMDFTFADQDAILRNRVFFGAKINYDVVSLGFEANLALAGGSTDDRSGTDLNCADSATPTNNCDATDDARAQQSFTASLAVDF